MDATGETARLANGPHYMVPAKDELRAYITCIWKLSLLILLRKIKTNSISKVYT
jgi:hypothetical protein